MNDKAKCLAIIILSLTVSAATSYLTTISILSTNTQSTQEKELPSNKVLLAYNVTFLADRSVVEVFSNETLHNLTIVYQYTRTNGTIATDNVNYGNYYPWWNSIIYLGATPSATYAVPDYIQALATTYVDPKTGITKISNPNFNVLEVYGYI